VACVYFAMSQYSVKAMATTQLIWTSANT